MKYIKKQKLRARSDLKRYESKKKTEFMSVNVRNEERSREKSFMEEVEIFS